MEAQSQQPPTTIPPLWPPPTSNTNSLITVTGHAVQAEATHKHHVHLFQKSLEAPGAGSQKTHLDMQLFHFHYSQHKHAAAFKRYELTRGTISNLNAIQPQRD